MLRANTSKARPSGNGRKHPLPLSAESHCRQAMSGSNLPAYVRESSSVCVSFCVVMLFITLILAKEKKRKVVFLAIYIPSMLC